MTGRYQVEGVIGRGAGGVVYRARQVDAGGRVVAYKRIAVADETTAAQVRDEITALAALDHPNAIRIFDVVEDSGAVAIVMQHAAGGSLAERLQHHGALRAGDAATVLIGIADALASAHAAGILHGDIKPSNILFTSDGHPLLSDFGAALLPTDGSGGVPVSSTPEYLDPLVALGQPYDDRSDVYALGVVAFEMLTGRRPVPGEPAPTAGAAADPVAAALSQVISAALSPEPLQRPPSAAALRDTLRDCLSVPAASVMPAPPVAAPARRMEPPTRTFGPRPPATPAVAPMRCVPWRRISAVAVAMVLVPSLLVVALRGGAAEAKPAATAVATARLQAAPRTCPHTPPAPVSGDVRHGDLAGTGCLSWLRVRSGTVEAVLPGRKRLLRVRVGGRGDQVLLGDWDCDGSDTVAVYRPSSGVVFEFSAWPSGSALNSGRGIDTGVDRGVASVASQQGCDEVVIKPPIDA